MGFYRGPNVVKNGLVFGYDTGYRNGIDNIDSYQFNRGEPTTNVVANPLPTTGWSTANAQGSAITRTYLEEDGKPFMRFSGVTNGNDYPRVTNSAFANSATITGTFSTSLEVRGTAGAVLRFRIYENGSTKITNTITLTSEWTRYTFDNQTTGFNLNQPYFNPATSDAIYDIRNIQVEAKAHSTPFTSNSRASDECLIDLKRTNDIDLTNVSFDSNAQMTFDGSDDYAVIPYSNTDLDGDAIFSVEAIIKRTGTMSNGGLWGIGGDAGLSGINGYVHGGGTNKISIDLWGTATFHTGVDYPLNEYVHIVWVKTTTGFSTSTLIIYVNGVAYTGSDLTVVRGSSHTPNLNTSTSGKGIVLGRVGPSTNNYYAVGEMPVFKVYNRALSAQEAKQNYNAIRSRFGI